MKNNVTTYIQKAYTSPFYLSIHLVLLFIIHSVYVYVYTVSSSLRIDYALQIFLRITIWTVPVLIYLMVLKINILDFLKLRQNLIKGIIWGIVIGLLVILLQGIGIYFQNNNITIKLNIGIGLWLKSIILVGFSEEVLFRGFILKKLRENISFGKSNIAQALLFLLIHFPGWILLNQFVYPNIIGNIAFIFIIGILMGYILKKTDSLWSCIIAHSFINFATICII